MPRIRAPIYFQDDPAIIEVPAHSLDEILAGEEFGIICMDIEGSEYFALKGMQRLLKSSHTLFVEYLPHHLRNVAGIEPKDLFDLIEPAGFDCLFVPSLNIKVRISEALEILQMMFDKELGDESIIFERLTKIQLG